MKIETQLTECCVNQSNNSFVVFNMARVMHLASIVASLFFPLILKSILPCQARLSSLCGLFSSGTMTQFIKKPVMNHLVGPSHS